MEKYVLFDRDGVINVLQDNSVKTPDEFVFLPFVLESFFALAKENIRAIVLTNQELLARGELDRTTLNAIHDKMYSMVEETGGKIHDVLVCPETDREDRTGWYPQPGLLLRAAKKHGFNLRKTYIVGAHKDCLQAAWAAGCKTAFVRTGKPFKTLEFLQQSPRQPDISEIDLLSAVVKIIRIYQTT